jgi:hypothetical protein
MPPEDRHKWFYSVAEAKTFITERAHANHMNVVELSLYDPQPINSTRKIKRHLIAWLLKIVFNLDITDLTTGTIWAVCVHQSDQS